MNPGAIFAGKFLIAGEKPELKRGFKKCLAKH